MRIQTLKKILAVLTAVLLVMTLAGCGSTPANEPAPAETPVSENTENDAADTETGNKTLVVYFSVTGNTKDIAEKIAEITGADVYEIRAAEEYTDADRNYNDPESRATKEQKDKEFRPEIGSGPVSLEGYTTVFIGYPIWWGEEPRILDTFVESHSFDGITVIPFCTSGSSGIGNSGQNLEKNAGSGIWLEGRRFASGTSKEDIAAWISGLQ